MTKDEVERVLDDRIAKGQASPGLYDCGLSYVVASLEGDTISFQWFDRMQTFEADEEAP